MVVATLGATPYPSKIVDISGKIGLRLPNVNECIALN